MGQDRRRAAGTTIDAGGAAPPRQPVTGRSTGRKVLQSIGVVATWASVVGLGTFGTFTDPATPLSGIRDDPPPHRLVVPPDDVGVPGYG
jgi:hypothetical protein